MTRAIVAGDVRRRSEVVRDLVLVLVADVSPAELFKRLSQLPGVHEFAGQDERRLTLRFAGGASAQIVVTTPVNAGAVLVQATGSERHLAELASARVRRAGSRLNGAALWRGSEFVPRPTRSAFYGALGLPFIPPELRGRAGRGGRGARSELPRLLETGDLRGFLHCHTNYSDGSNIGGGAGARLSGGGLPVRRHHRPQPGRRVRRRASARTICCARPTRSTRSTAGSSGIRVLKGVEADILADGRVDFEERCWRGSTSSSPRSTAGST